MQHLRKQNKDGEEGEIQKLVEKIYCQQYRNLKSQNNRNCFYTS
jgi:hypothetical protein